LSYVALAVYEWFQLRFGGGRDLLKFVRKIFINDGFVKALPWITLAIGLILFFASYFVDQEISPRLKDALKSLGQVIVTSGVVSAILNSFKYMGIFRDVVHEVIFSIDHLKTRNDLSELWKRITFAICEEKFPDLSDLLHKNVIGNYLPAKKNFYYTDYLREVTISFHDKERDIVSLYEEVDLKLHPADNVTEVKYTYQCFIDSRTPPELACVDIHSLWIDDIEPNYEMKTRNYVDEFGGQGTIQSYEISLSGKDVYRIRRSSTRRLCISKDPVNEYSSEEFIHGCTAKFRSTDSGILPIFQSVGTEDFDDKAMAPNGTWQVHREFGGLMFPRQGYLLFIQRQI